MAAEVVLQRLDTGLLLAVQPLPESPVASVQLWMEAGASDGIPPSSSVAPSEESFNDGTAALERRCAVTTAPGSGSPEASTTSPLMVAPAFITMSASGVSAPGVHSASIVAGIRSSRTGGSVCSPAELGNATQACSGVFPALPDSSR